MTATRIVVASLITGIVFAVAVIAATAGKTMSPFEREARQLSAKLNGLPTLAEYDRDLHTINLRLAQVPFPATIDAKAHFRRAGRIVTFFHLARISISKWSAQESRVDVLAYPDKRDDVCHALNKIKATIDNLLDNIDAPITAHEEQDAVIASS